MTAMKTNTSWLKLTSFSLVACLSCTVFKKGSSIVQGGKGLVTHPRHPKIWLDQYSSYSDLPMRLGLKRLIEYGSFSQATQTVCEVNHISSIYLGNFHLTI
ncbi:hypothetical protein OUZ56_015110 [Daphnia magna]|uniref:Secreted protein n=1 Tax=Daphnia magna TaxID=35525 RepID=A0ABR0ALU1_9CRUS|nr:hypothetical protein OUZ56_015110 [Daphnia magna]